MNLFDSLLTALLDRGTGEVFGIPGDSHDLTSRCRSCG
jgi:hypothetical protein